MFRLLSNVKRCNIFDNISYPTVTLSYLLGMVGLKLSILSLNTIQMRLLREKNIYILDYTAPFLAFFSTSSFQLNFHHVVRAVMHFYYLILLNLILT